MKVERRSGFTLLELMMVIIIIAILASIALPQYLRVSERTRASEALNMLAAVRSSELRFAAASPTNLFTQTLTQLDIEVPASAMWAYTVTGTAAGSNVRATRNGGNSNGKYIDVDLNSGDMCTNDGLNSWNIADTDGAC